MAHAVRPAATPDLVAQTTSSTAPAPTRRRRRHSGQLRFARHYGEMVVSMWVGMAVGAVAFGALFAATGTSLREVRYAQPELFGVGLAFVMTGPMVLWMRHRHHPWLRTLEMAGAMFAPLLVALPLFWTGAIEARAIAPIVCCGMYPTMYLAMLLRRHEYAAGHGAH